MARQLWEISLDDDCTDPRFCRADAGMDRHSQGARTSCVRWVICWGDWYYLDGWPVDVPLHPTQLHRPGVQPDRLEFLVQPCDFVHHAGCDGHFLTNRAALHRMGL